jgi:uncharacterized protein
MRIFLDANILFSAAKSDGAIRSLLALLARAGHHLCADGYVLEEARRNLEIKAPDGVTALDVVMRSVTLTAGTSTVRSALPLPEKDQPVMESAIQARCDLLVTGDRAHFGALYETTIQGVLILSPAQVARKLL